MILCFHNSKGESHMTSVRSLLALACTSSLLSACYSDMTVMRDDAAKRTAAPNFISHCGQVAQHAPARRQKDRRASHLPRIERLAKAPQRLGSPVCESKMSVLRSPDTRLGT